MCVDYGTGYRYRFHDYTCSYGVRSFSIGSIGFNSFLFGVLFQVILFDIKGEEHAMIDTSDR